MGGSSWSDAAYSERASERARTNAPVFAYSQSVQRGEASGVHSTLDPKRLAGRVRESRDSAPHPESNAIQIVLDVTGSMSSVVKDIHAKLPKLMGLLTEKGYIKDPQIMMSAVGDLQDSYPLQVGQFESGIEIENDITNVILEGGGAGPDHSCEAYELAMFVGARKTSIDCFEKRGKKGFFFIIGDEMAHDRINGATIRSVFGEEGFEPVTTERIVQELKEKFNVFYILPQNASHGSDQVVIQFWENLLGRANLLRLRRASDVAELIATQVGLAEGTINEEQARSDLRDHGLTAQQIEDVMSAVNKSVSNVPVAVTGQPLATSSAARGVERL